MFKNPWLIFLKASFFVLILRSPLTGFEHHQSPVNFLEYTQSVIQNNQTRRKPFFLLFSAEWCHWCKILETKTLKNERVYSFLNQNFINVFIDADIHTGVYLRYNAKGFPFTVFLNPNATVYFKFPGVLYAEEFLEVLQGVRENVIQGKELYAEEFSKGKYQPPSSLEEGAIKELNEMFHEGMLDNVDLREGGLGQGEKTIMPYAFVYALKKSSGERKKEHLRWISKALRKALDNLYDPLEGGFFRFAETRDWQIPHYEKMADLNAGIVHLIYEVNREEPSAALKAAAQKTLGYLCSILYEPGIGSFLSFQEADTVYYFLNEEGRSQEKTPPVIQRIYTDRLAKTLMNLMEVLDHNRDFSLENKIQSSLNFLAEMILDGEKVFHHFSIDDGQWRSNATLEDYAILSILFTRASNRFKRDMYFKTAVKLIRDSRTMFYDKERKIFIESDLDPEVDMEFVMEMNGWFALALLENEAVRVSEENSIVQNLVTYFSGIEELLEDSIWDSKDWNFIERYVPYLIASERTVNGSVQTR